MKKRVISLLLALVLAVSLLPTAAWAAGTEEISTAEAFAQMRANGNYILTEDITVSTPYANDFSGTFDGNGHTITLRISSTSYNTGLFSKIGQNGTVKNVITAGSVTGRSVTGAVAGLNYGTIQKCWNQANVTGTTNVGGIVGTNGSSSSSNLIHATVTGCYNTGSVKGTRYIGGIVGNSANSTLEKCASTGTIDTTNALRGGITGNSAASRDTITDCYWLNTSCEGGKEIGTSFKSTELKTVAGKLGSSWTTEKGTLVLKFGSTEPSVSVTASPASLQMVNGSSQPTSTLTVKTENINMDGAAVEWSTEQTDIISLNDGGDDLHKIAQALQPGTAAVTVTVTPKNGTPVTGSADITVLPCFTTVEIEPAAPSVTVAAGQTVQAVVSVFQNTGSYDPADDARLGYKWYWYQDVTDKHEIEGETGRTCTIPTEFPGATGSLYLYVEVYDNGRPAQNAAGETLSGYAPLSYGDDALLTLDKAALTLEKLGVSSTTITEDTKLNLPSEGENGSRITWESSDSSVIDPMTGKVTLPAEGEQKVTLTANLTLNDSTGKLPREFTIKSKAAQAVDADKETLEKAAKALSTLHPRFGKDSNVQTMVETRLANAGFSGVGVKFISAEPTGATAVQAASAISSIGNITYFYDDPNKTINERTQWFDTYKAYFTLTCGSETQENVAVPVTVYWDVNKVCRVMTEEVLDRVTLPELTEGNLNLPTAVEGKQWTKIVWTSSDPGIISNGGVVTRSAIDRQTVLTAGFTFQRTNDVTGNEQPIVLYKVFEVTVKGNADAADRAALYQQKLNDALAAPGLKDFVTGAKLTADANGVYTTSNDIQFPTTRDLKIDGKYTPVVITSSDPGVIEAPTTPNSARVWVYRPLPGEAAKTVTLTVKILDRPNGPQPGDDLSAMRVLASKEIKVTVQPLTQDEIDAEIALMERVKVKVNYWNGIRNANVERDNVTTDLHAFQECYLNDNGELTWVYDREDLKNHGIVPVPLDNWYDQQIWRLFRSSNAGVVAHENLLVTRQGDSKAVTITSYLSSETLGKYAEKYPQNADFQKLYKQPVTIDLVVTGTQYAQGNNEGRVQAAKRALAVRPTVTVSFSLSGRGMGFTESNLEYAEGSTVYDVFSDLLAEHRYTCKRRGSYIAAITSNSGVTLEEFDEGKNSGWMYRVNGELVGRYMSAQGLNDGDRIELYFTSDWTSEPGAEGWQKPDRIETIVNADGSVTKIETKSDGTVIETTTWRDGSTLTAETSPNGRVETVEKRADGTTVETVESASGGITASVSVPKSVGSTRVDIPVSKPTGSMVAVIVHPDGTEEIVRGSVVTETGVALRAEGNVQLKIIDNAKRFNDMANHWAKDAVEFASSRELFNGVGNDAFGPDLSMTRGMVSTVLARLAGADTAGGETWYAKGTVWAVENGISDGTNPEQQVTREQLAAMLYRYAGSPAVSGELGFDDADSISAWARDAVRWCVDNGILNGVGGNRMTPQDLARRGQVAAMLMRFLQATV
ncbi:MAG: immunoglobulin-like domain-containing protein [Oscillospiraceae bacterium]